AREHDVAKATLHLVEFRSRYDVFLASRENARDFLLRVRNALGRGRVSGENLWDSAGATLLVGLDALEEGYVRVRIVPRLVHVLNTEEIRFAFGVARKLQERQRYRHIQALVQGVSDRKSTRLNSSHVAISYAVFCLKK